MLSRRFYIILVVSILCAAILKVVIALVIMSGGIVAVPQDCAGVDFDLNGRVIGTNAEAVDGASIQVMAEMERLGGENLIVETNSDAQGDFQVSGYAFACALFTIEVNTSGYQTGTVTGEVWQTLPPESREFIITLEPE